MSSDNNQEVNDLELEVQLLELQPNMKRANSTPNGNLD